jgi:hypothetical protein
MSQVRVLLLKCFKLRGLGPDKEAIRVLCEYLETSADASTEIPRIVEHIRSNPGCEPPYPAQPPHSAAGLTRVSALQGNQGAQLHRTHSCQRA